MEDRTCFKCKEEFKYPSVLKRHLEISSRCSIPKEEVTNYFKNHKSYKNKLSEIINIQEPIIPIPIPIPTPINKSFTCNICNYVFTKKHSLERHNKNIDCKIPVNNKSSTTINNTTNNTINNTINNITNNTINIQHINPFGFEDVRTIPIDEMKTILITGQEAGFKIIKTIYNKIENKNFYKPNMSRPEIACLNTDFNLTIYRSKEFCDALFDRCIAFLHHMLYLCKNEYSKSSIKSIYDNIEFIETTIRTEIYDKQLQNIIESEFRNNNVDNKDRIINFIKGIKNNNDNKEQSTTLMNNVLSLENESAREYCISITDDELNRVLGDPKVILGLNKREFIEDFKYNRFEDTRFYKFWEDRIKNETSYINKCKTATIGDMKMIKDKATKVDLMLNVIRLRADHLKPDELIDLDVDGFQIIEIEGNDVDSDDVDAANLEDLEDF